LPGSVTIFQDAVRETLTIAAVKINTADCYIYFIILPGSSDMLTREIIIFFSINSQIFYKYAGNGFFPKQCIRIKTHKGI